VNRPGLAPPDGAVVAGAVWRKVVFLGTGLIGGSLAAALRREFLAECLIGCGPQAEQARALGLVDQVIEDPAAAVRGADLVVLAAPPSVLPDLLRQIAPALDRLAVVTDVASTKQGVIAAARTHLGPGFSRFVPAHPIAGSERHGPDAADSTLFQNARCVLCPQPETDPAALQRVEATWRAIGARPSRLSAREHDEVFAAVSHLPHLVAFALAATLGHRADAESLLGWAGGGLRDTTRIAASSADLWADILLENSAAVAAVTEQFLLACQKLQTAIQTQDRAGLVDQIEQAAGWRRRLQG
jgi:prephenate dehydrogenase